MTNPFLEIINKSLTEPQASLLGGILFGVRAKFPKDFYDALIQTGTVHIIALSGQNISILSGILTEVFLVFGRKMSLVLTGVSISMFVLFVGVEPPVVRAAIMGTISLLSVYFGRQSWGLLSLILAAGTMLIVKPEWFGEVSFQLSFLATLGIILFGRVQYKQPKSWLDEIWREVKVNFRTTLSAQIFTLPVVIFQFGQISLISPLSNVLIGWLISPIMIGGFVLSLIGFVWQPLAYILGLIMWVPLTYMVKVIEITSKIPGAAIKL